MIGADLVEKADAPPLLLQVKQNAVYGWLVDTWVFVVTNALMLLAGLVGFAITLHFRRNMPAEAQREERLSGSRSSS